MIKASLALVTSAVLAVALAAPVRADPPFEETVGDAVAAVDPVYAPSKSENKVLEVPSEIAPEQKIKSENAVFRSGSRAVLVTRTVGAVAPVGADGAAGEVVGRSRVKRKKAKARNVVITSTADEWGPGLTIASWTERKGVNYTLSSSEAMDAKTLLKLVKKIPADPTKAPAAAQDAIGRKRAAGPPARSTSNKYVDGSGAANDDLDNEANLCQGCAYSTGNYTGMWQYILWADGKLSGYSIDCVFGPTTAASTRSWQSSKGLAADGYVGAGTRGTADNKLSGSGGVVPYLGSSSTVYFNRTDGAYWLGFDKITYSGTSVC